MVAALQKHTYDNTTVFVIVLCFLLVPNLLLEQPVVDLDFGSGAVLFCLVLFGFRIIPGIILAFIVSTLLVQTAGLASHGGSLLIHGVIEILAPILSVWIMIASQVADFSNLHSVDNRQIIFLLILASVIEMITRFIILGIADTQPVDVFVYITNHMSLHFLGSMLAVFLCIKTYQKINFGALSSS